MDIEFKISKNPVNYKKALQLLEKRVNHVKKGGRELVWFLEHPITYTAGVRSKKEEILSGDNPPAMNSSLLLHAFFKISLLAIWPEPLVGPSSKDND